MQINTITELKNILRNGPYAWPGGYEIYFYADDGELICYNCVKSNLRQIFRSIQHKQNDGWRIIGYVTSETILEDELEICAHCGKELK